MATREGKWAPTTARERELWLAGYRKGFIEANQKTAERAHENLVRAGARTLALPVPPLAWPVKRKGRAA